MAKAKTKAQAAEEEAAFPNPFPDLGADEPEVTTEPAAEDAKGLKVLETEVAGLKSGIETERQTSARLQSMVDTLMLRPAVAPVAPAPAPAPVAVAPVEVNFDGMPDPVADLSGFQRELGRRVNEAVSSGAAPTTAPVPANQPNTTDQANYIWDRFTQRHGDLSKHEDLAITVARRKMNELQMRGLDVGAAIMMNPDGFVDGVATDMSTMIEGFKEGAVDNDDGDPAPVIKPQVPANRTDGLPGGSPSGQGGGPQTPEPESEGDTLSGMLKKVQREMGIA